MEALGGLYLAFLLFLLVVAVLWILMPFAIFGTKDILRELADEQRRTNRLLAALVEQRQAAALPPMASEPKAAPAPKSSALPPAPDIAGLVVCGGCGKFNSNLFTRCVNCGTDLPTATGQLSAAR